MPRRQPPCNHPCDLTIVRHVFLVGRFHGRLGRAATIDYRPDIDDHLELASRAGIPEVVRIRQLAWMPDLRRYRAVVSDAIFQTAQGMANRLELWAQDGWTYTVRSADPHLRSWRDADYWQRDDQADVAVDSRRRA